MYIRLAFVVIAVSCLGCGAEDGATGPAGGGGPPGDKGDAVLIAVTPEPAGANCANGGQRVDTGLDADQDKLLDPQEVTQTTYVCNGRGPGVAGFQRIAQLTGPGGPIAEIVAASPDGMLLAYTSSTAHSVGLVDLADPSAPRALATVDVAAAVSHGNGEPTSVAITPDGRYALVTVKDPTDPIANADPGALVFIDLATRTIAGTVAVGVGPDSVHVTPDGTRAVIAIEDEEDADNNAVAQARPGSVQIVTINAAMPASSTVATVALAPTVGNLRSDPQPELVDITGDGRTAIVSLQENNAIAVIDLATATVTRYIDAGTSSHARADLASNNEVAFAGPGFVGQLQPDGVCLLSDGRHFVTANEGDTANGAFAPGVLSGGRGFSVFTVDGERVHDSGDAVEALAVRAGAYPENRSGARGIELEGCATGRFGGAEYAFLTSERGSWLVVADVSLPEAPVLIQLLGAPLRPESAVTIPARGLVVVGGEGDGVGGGLWIYQAVTDPADAGNGLDVYDARTPATPFSALGALAFDPSTGFLVATPDNAFGAQRLWLLSIDHGDRRMELVREIRLRDAAGAALTGHDPEGIAINPEGGFVIASEGTAGNGGSTTCVGSGQSNRLMFFDASGRLDPLVDSDGIVDLPCGEDSNAIDWTLVTGNGFEGVAVVDQAPTTRGGLEVYVAFQRALTGEGQDARIGVYDVDGQSWRFYFYTLEPDPGGSAGSTFLSELIHVEGDLFAVIERDQGIAGEAGNKTIRTFRLATGGLDEPGNPLEKSTAVDLLAGSFRFDQEKIEGLALGGGALWVTNDNDGGRAPTFFVKLDPAVLGDTTQPPPPPEPVPGQDAIVLNEINSQGADFIELFNRSDAPVSVAGWRLRDNDATHVFVLPPGTTIAANARLLIEGDSSTAPLHLTFGLGSADSALLLAPTGAVVDQHSWQAHVASASRCPDGTGAFISGTTATPGAANSCPP
jgi:DNA-binding beta-propeller fold protein YncE